jgi:COMM domain containing 9
MPSNSTTNGQNIRCLSHSPLRQWKEVLTTAQISLPRLQSFDWRVDVKTASEQISRMAVPTVLVELQVQEGTSGRKVQFELTQEALQAMLDGLGKIRDQLNAVNAAKQ